MENNLENAKKGLFSHADPSLAIKEMKTMHTHLHKTKALLHQTVDLMGTIKIGVSNTSSHLLGTSSMYDSYESELKKADLYVKGLKKKEEENAKKIKLSFWFLICVVVFVILRRLLFPSFYRNIFKIF